MTKLRVAFLSALVLTPFSAFSVDSAPSATVQDDSASGFVNTELTIDVLANDTGEWVGASFTQPSNGTSRGGSGGLVYVPNVDFIGTDSFTYTLTSVGGEVLTATVTVEINPLAEVNNDAVGTYMDTAVDIDVMANDTGVFVDGSFTPASNGIVTQNGPSVLYTPNSGFVGIDSFSYTLIDTLGVGHTALVQIKVAEPLVTNDDFASTRTDSAVEISVLDNDTGDFVSGAFSTPTHGVLSQAGPNVIYTPPAGFTGMDMFTYTMTDSLGATSTASVKVSVNNIVFTEVSQAAGIDYLQHNHIWNEGDPRNHASYMSGGAAAGDYDGDGFVDLYVTREDDSDILYRNLGDGTFEDVTAAAGISRVTGSNGAGWVDIDNDNDLDLYVTSIYDTRFYLYVNNGQGGFTEEAIARGASTEGTDTHLGYSVSFGDYDNDGFTDIHVTEWRPDMLNPDLLPSNARLLRNLGALNPGHFEDTTDAAGVSIDGIPGTRDGAFGFTSRFVDFDRDGFLDLAIASDFGESRLFWNDGDGTFTDGTVAAGVGGDENGMGFATGDVNGDGLEDMFVTSIFDPQDTCIGQSTCGWGNTGNRLYLNNGDRTFTDATETSGVRDGGWGWAATFLDYDNDGDLDLVQTNGVQFPWSAIIDPYMYDQTRFWENDGTGVFVEVASSVGILDTGSGKGLLKFDYDNDGDEDIFIVNNGDRPLLYRNDGGNEANDWLSVRLRVHTDAVAATVKVQKTSTSDFITRLASYNNNFLGQDSSVVHFGLGDMQGGTVHKVIIDMGDTGVFELDAVEPNMILEFPLLWGLP